MSGAAGPAGADGLSTAAMLVLSFGTGVLDAATYLGLDQVFTANMTGNVIFVGLGLADAEDVPLLRATVALVGFAMGAILAGTVQRGHHARPNADVVAASLLMACALTVGGSALVLHLVDPGATVFDLLAGALGAAMGAQAVAARRVAVGDVSTVVVTSTLAGLFAEAAWTGGTAGRATTLRRAGAVGTMFGGAVVGAFTLRAGVALPVAISSGLLLVVASTMVVRVVRDRRRDSLDAATG
ncbi:YoaK family protein [Nocardioides sp. zg-1228]|uniref:YoaK family protein n=1 Tax=Nocardioides sp. zg-1228 TaxID=2763008 RepID=UPI0016436250|nr:YoaK family protein [Nocardioides sp. zg-1228]MBC2934640.1 DUF1275 domain-containing protein [Nocardioides sp. zg-1228]QSF59385.1 DUF1275 domain-containing protein [Nocardioides sp. zg-1228]